MSTSEYYEYYKVCNENLRQKPNLITKQAADIYNIYNIYKQICHARIQEFSSGGVQVSLTKKAMTSCFFVLFF